uniref:Uncharacterized protein n=1 Tax=Eutreptiella gymnastica TaxID=73025 RepID=A0A7S1JAK9_9EUGL
MAECRIIQNPRTSKMKATHHMSEIRVKKLIQAQKDVMRHEVARRHKVLESEKSCRLQIVLKGRSSNVQVTESLRSQEAEERHRMKQAKIKLEKEEAKHRKEIEELLRTMWKGIPEIKTRTLALIQLIEDEGVARQKWEDREQDQWRGFGSLRRTEQRVVETRMRRKTDELEMKRLNAMKEAKIRQMEQEKKQQRAVHKWHSDFVHLMDDEQAARRSEEGEETVQRGIVRRRMQERHETIFKEAKIIMEKEEAKFRREIKESFKKVGREILENMLQRMAFTQVMQDEAVERNYWQQKEPYERRSFEVQRRTDQRVIETSRLRRKRDEVERQRLHAKKEMDIQEAEQEQKQRAMKQCHYALMQLMYDEEATRYFEEDEENVQRGALERHMQAEYNIADSRTRRVQVAQAMDHLVGERNLQMKAVEQKKERDRLLVARRREQREEKERQLCQLIEQLKQENSKDHLQQTEHQAVLERRRSMLEPQSDLKALTTKMMEEVTMQRSCTEVYEQKQRGFLAAIKRHELSLLSMETQNNFQRGNTEDVASLFSSSVLPFDRQTKGSSELSTDAISTPSISSIASSDSPSQAHREVPSLQSEAEKKHSQSDPIASQLGLRLMHFVDMESMIVQQQDMEALTVLQQREATERSKIISAEHRWWQWQEDDRQAVERQLLKRKFIEQVQRVKCESL